LAPLKIPVKTAVVFVWEMPILFLTLKKKITERDLTCESILKLMFYWWVHFAEQLLTSFGQEPVSLEPGKSKACCKTSS